MRSGKLNVGLSPATALLLAASPLFGCAPLPVGDASDGTLHRPTTDPAGDVYTQLLAPENVSDVDAWHAQHHVKPAAIMYQSVIDPDEDGNVDADDVTKWLIAHVPEDYAGILTLDWEATGLNAAPPRVDQALELIHLVRELRPSAQLGFYLNQRFEAQRRDRELLEPVIEASDVLMPSVYQFTTRPTEAYEEFIGWTLGRGKPVLLYVWHRYHPSDRQKPWRLIDPNEWTAHVASLLAVEVDGDRPDGLILWGTEHARIEQAWEREAEGAFRRDDERWDALRQAYEAEGATSGNAHDYARLLYESLFARAHAVLER